MTLTELKSAAQQIVGRTAGSPVRTLFRRHNPHRPATVPSERILTPQSGASRSTKCEFVPCGNPDQQPAGLAQVVEQNRLRESCIRKPYFCIQGKHGDFKTGDTSARSAAHP